MKSKTLHLTMRCRAPWWAYVFKLLEDGLPQFKGKSKLLNLARRRIVNKRVGFPWRMKNTNFVGISPGDIAGHFGVGRTCFKTGTWEPHVEGCLRMLLKKGSVALDIGANIGYFSSVMSQCVGKEGQVYAFEPVPDTFAQLTLTKKCNSSSNLKLFQLALGEANGTTTIAFSPSLSGNASLHRQLEGDARAINIDVKTIDSLYSHKLLRECQLIKIDVEGHELSVFRGGSNYFRLCRPIVIYEFNYDTAVSAGYTLLDIQTEINSWGGDYKHFFVWEHGCRMEADMKSVKIPPGCYADFVAVPKIEAVIK
jgi:FkbM family methyltransferase